jgi:dTDP-4-amino-4,6-dideoxygalactose transaminase
LAASVTASQRRETVPVADPRRAVLEAQGEIAVAFERVLRSGQYVHGPEQAAFEREFGIFLDLRHCVGVACGTDALELALIATGCRPGDEVVVAANAGGYASTAARKVGLRPRLADVDAGTLSLSASTVEAALSPRVRAVVVTRLYGLLGEVEALTRCADSAVVRSAHQLGTAGPRTAHARPPTIGVPILDQRLGKRPGCDNPRLGD